MSDRLEEIKHWGHVELVGPQFGKAYGAVRLEDFEWLIAEVERLRALVPAEPAKPGIQAIREVVCYLNNPVEPEPAAEERYYAISGAVVDSEAKPGDTLYVYESEEIAKAVASKLNASWRAEQEGK